MPNISNSSWFHPQTRFRPKRPPEMWSIVTICLAATIGWTIGAWTVAKTLMFLVCDSRPVAHVRVSSDSSSNRDGPSYPFHRAIGRMNSIPASSAICASARLFGQVASQLSGTVVIASPPLQFGANSPSFNALPLNIEFLRAIRRLPLRTSGSGV